MGGRGGAVVEDSSVVAVYVPAKRPAGVTARSDVFEDRTTERAVGAIVAVVEQEGPVVPEVVLRRLAAWFGVSRITDKYRERFGGLLGTAVAGGAVVRVGDALWVAGADVEGYDGYRAAGEEEDSQRDIEWVPLVERAAAVRPRCGRRSPCRGRIWSVRRRAAGGGAGDGEDARGDGGGGGCRRGVGVGGGGGREGSDQLSAAGAVV